MQRWVGCTQLTLRRGLSDLAFDSWVAQAGWDKVGSKIVADLRNTECFCAVAAGVRPPAWASHRPGKQGQRVHKYVKHPFKCTCSKRCNSATGTVYQRSFASNTSVHLEVFDDSSNVPVACLCWGDGAITGANCHAICHTTK